MERKFWNFQIQWWVSKDVQRKMVVHLEALIDSKRLRDLTIKTMTSSSFQIQLFYQKKKVKNSDKLPATELILAP